MDFLKPPEPLRMSGDADKNWKLFNQRFELFVTASDPPEKLRSAKTKVALLLSIAGEEALEVFNTFTFADSESREGYATVVAKFEPYCATHYSEVHERYVFRNMSQAPGEHLEHFLRDLLKQARECNFGALTDSMIRDQLVFGIGDDKTREKLLSDNNSTLDKVEQVCKAAEATAAHRGVWDSQQKHAQVQSIKVTLKIDTGSQANLLPFGVFRRMHPRPALKPSCGVLRSYGGGVIKHAGMTRLEVTLDDHTAALDFFVVHKGQAILGLRASEQLGLIPHVHAASRTSSEEIVDEFRHLFTGTGCVKRVYNMVLNKGTVPVVQPTRRVPLTLQKPLKEELECMERGHIITKVDKPTDWEIEYLGAVISKDGIRPSPSLIKCMLQTPAPEDKSAVQRMLGVANYFGKYLPSLAERTSLLRSLLKRDTMFEWSANHALEWEQLCADLSR
nr:uncharacterized protein LOC119169736 [Rhipicephalus microplus]